MTWVQQHVMLMPFCLWDMVMIWTFVTCEEEGNDFFQWEMSIAHSSFALKTLILFYLDIHSSQLTDFWLHPAFPHHLIMTPLTRLQKINNSLCSKLNTWQITLWLSYQWMQTLRFMRTHLNRQDIRINMWGEWQGRSFCWKNNKITI